MNQYLSRSNFSIFIKISVCAQKFLTLLHRLEVIATYDVLMQITREMAKDRVLHRMYKTNEQNHFENEKLEELIRNKKEVLEYEENTKRKAREAHERDIDKLISVNAKEIRNNMFVPNYVVYGHFALQH